MLVWNHLELRYRPCSEWQCQWIMEQCSLKSLTNLSTQPTGDKGLWCFTVRAVDSVSGGHTRKLLSIRVGILHSTGPLTWNLKWMKVTKIARQDILGWWNPHNTTDKCCCQALRQWWHGPAVSLEDGEPFLLGFNSKSYRKILPFALKWQWPDALCPHNCGPTG